MSAELIAELREIVRKRADCLRVQEAAAISEAADLLSSLALAERGEGWQPIETAPKDVPLLLLYGPSDGGGFRITQGGWNRGGAMHMPHWNGIHQPTHWMALPPAPASGRGA